MDNEKKPDYLEKILEKGGTKKAANEDPALDQKKILAPLKDESTTLPQEKENLKNIEANRDKNSGAGRGMGGGSASPNQPEGEYKTPRQKMLEKGRQSPGGSSGRGGGSPTVKEPDEMIKEKNDVINPDETLSKKQDGKQQKQETQQQQAQHKASGHEKASPSKISPREWMTKTLASNSPKETEQENHIAVAKDRVKTNIKGLIDKSIAEKENAPNPKTNSKEKNHEIALNSAKSPSPKSIKR